MKRETNRDQEKSSNLISKSMLETFRTGKQVTFDVFLLFSWILFNRFSSHCIPSQSPLCSLVRITYDQQVVAEAFSIFFRNSADFRVIRKCNSLWRWCREQGTQYSSLIRIKRQVAALSYTVAYPGGTIGRFFRPLFSRESDYLRSRIPGEICSFWLIYHLFRGNRVSAVDFHVADRHSFISFLKTLFSRRENDRIELETKYLIPPGCFEPDIWRPNVRLQRSLVFQVSDNFYFQKGRWNYVFQRG